MAPIGFPSCTTALALASAYGAALLFLVRPALFLPRGTPPFSDAFPSPTARCSRGSLSLTRLMAVWSVPSPPPEAIVACLRSQWFTCCSPDDNKMRRPCLKRERDRESERVRERGQQRQRVTLSAPREQRAVGDGNATEEGEAPRCRKRCRPYQKERSSTAYGCECECGSA